MFRMVATDLDGTLLRSDLTVSQRTRDVLAELEALGIPVVPATARQVTGVRMLQDQVQFPSWVVTSNGAVVADLRTGDHLAEATLTEEAQRAFADSVLEAAPGAVFFGVRNAGTQPAAERAYQAISVFDDHKRDPADWEVLTRDELLAQANNKVAVRHPDLPALELYALISKLEIPDVTVTNSGAPFLDVSAAGVSKAWGLTKITDHLGISPDEVVAFGDALNDIAMLAWAGHAVAMDHAGREVKAVADEIAPSNDDDGLAQVLEKLIMDGQFKGR